MGENPVMSDPNLLMSGKDWPPCRSWSSRTSSSRRRRSTPTSSFPPLASLEVDGTITNTERRIQRVRPAVRPAGHARPDIEILADLAGRMGRPIFAGEPTAAAVMEEIAGLLPAFAGVHYDRLGENGLQWPCLSRGPRRDAGPSRAGNQAGKARFVPVGPTPGAEQPDEAYPYVLNTGRILEHYQTGTMTRRTVPLPEIAPENLVEMNPRTPPVKGSRAGRRSTSSRGAGRSGSPFSSPTVARAVPSSPRSTSARPPPTSSPTTPSTPRPRNRSTSSARRKSSGGRP